MDLESAAPRQSLAGQYFEASLEPLPVNRWRRFKNHGWAVAELLLPDLVFGVLFIDGVEPKDPALVHVVRRSDRVSVATFEYDYLLSAINHRDQLVQRLQTVQIFDFCRELGLDINGVGTPFGA